MKKALFILLVIAFTTTATATLNRQIVEESSYRWDCVYWALSAVESEFNNLAVSSKGAAGVVQIMPEGSGGYLDEANRLLREKRYSNNDRFCPVKSREMWEVVMKYRNPGKSLSKAIKLHNPRAGSWYHKRVLAKYEEFSKTIR